MYPGTYLGSEIDSATFESAILKQHVGIGDAALSTYTMLNPVAELFR